MPRPAGARNARYETRRLELIERLISRLASQRGRHASLRDLANAAGVSVPTLTHYFGTREALVAAILSNSLEKGQPYLLSAAKPSGSFAQSIAAAAEELVMGFRMALGGIFSVGLIEGLHHEELGPLFIATGLEPTIEAYRQRLDVHVARGEMRATNTRFAALVLVAPIVITFLHQNELGGAGTWPMNIDAFVRSHVDGFVLGYRSTLSGASPKSN